MIGLSTLMKEVSTRTNEPSQMSKTGKSIKQMSTIAISELCSGVLGK